MVVHTTIKRLGDTPFVEVPRLSIGYIDLFGCQKRKIERMGMRDHGDGSSDHFSFAALFVLL